MPTAAVRVSRAGHASKLGHLDSSEVHDVPADLPGQPAPSAPTMLSLPSPGSDGLPTLPARRFSPRVNTHSARQVSEGPVVDRVDGGSTPTEQGAVGKQRSPGTQRVSFINNEHPDSNAATAGPSTGSPSLKTEREVSALLYYHPDVNNIYEVNALFSSF